MHVSMQSISCAAISLLCITNVYAQQNDEIERIAENIRSAPDMQAIRQGMAELVAVDSAAAATAFANELVRIEATLDRENESTLIPYLSLVFDFTDTTDIRQILIPTLERLLEGEILDSERIYLSAVLAKFGAQEKVQGLIDEYRGANSLSRAATAVELLCRTNQDQAVRFIVDEALNSGDPTQKLVTERCLREVGNPASLDLMRRWDSVSSGDFDLIVAKYYLQSITQFGDSTDIEFVEWVNSNAEDLFHPEAFESEIRPLIETARAKIDESAETRFPWPLTVLLILVLGIVIIGLVIRKRRRSE